MQVKFVESSRICWVCARGKCKKNTQNCGERCRKNAEKLARRKKYVRDDFKNRKYRTFLESNISEGTVGKREENLPIDLKLFLLNFIFEIKKPMETILHLKPRLRAFSTPALGKDKYGRKEIKITKFAKLNNRQSCVGGREIRQREVHISLCHVWATVSREENCLNFSREKPSPKKLKEGSCIKFCRQRTDNHRATEGEGRSRNTGSLWEKFPDVCRARNVTSFPGEDDSGSADQSLEENKISKDPCASRKISYVMIFQTKNICSRS